MSMTTFLTLKLLFMLLLLTLLHTTTKADSLENKPNLFIKQNVKIFQNNKTDSVHKSVNLRNLTDVIYKSSSSEARENVAKHQIQTMEKKEKITEGVLKANSKLMKRLKRQHLSTSGSTAMTSSSSTYDLTALNHHQLSLPSVPLPPPPPFPNTNFNLSPFGSAGGLGGVGKSMNAFAFQTQNHHHQTPSSSLCGGVLKARHGVIQTPNFPHKFTTPIECIWVIDASELMPHSGHNISIVVYLTQLYVLGGLKFTEYMYYSDDYKVPAHRVFTLTEDDVTQVAWVQFNSQYLEIRFRMSSLDGTHLRALDRLLDVYGFNMTYEVEPVKEYQCNTLQCRFLGHCYAKADFSSYYCSCFPGFSGMDCGRGPLCEDPHTNICQNGGTCKHIGDAAITCHCPVGYKGTKCEIPDISEITMGCTTNSSALDCHRECDFDNGREGGISLLKTSRTSARSGKTRYEVTIRLGANLTAFYRHIDGEQRAKEQLPSFLEKHVSKLYLYFYNKKTVHHHFFLIKSKNKKNIAKTKYEANLLGKINVLNKTLEVYKTIISF
ncbi:hypothetical protein FF38_07451 [Lucilia cuprina]|uniref:Uncharacterized protein n=1 Tax=Lucilia cuprina TaxID=7375 RepID=A0A0L0CG37_LUCCU|nr:hypothetical protein FF38_07451 [Lucilia cuprina]